MPRSLLASQQEPYTMSKGAQLEGFCMDLLSEIAKKLGLKYRVQMVRDGSYGRQDESGHWNGMIGEVVRGVSMLKTETIFSQLELRLKTFQNEQKWMKPCLTVSIINAISRRQTWPLLH